MVFSSLATSNSGKSTTPKVPRSRMQQVMTVPDDGEELPEIDQLANDVRRMLLLLSEAFDERGMTVSELSRKNRHAVYTKERRDAALDKAMALGYVSIRFLKEYRDSVRFSMFVKLTRSGTYYVNRLNQGRA